MQYPGSWLDDLASLLTQNLNIWKDEASSRKLCYKKSSIVFTALSLSSSTGKRIKAGPNMFAATKVVE